MKSLAAPSASTPPNDKLTAFPGAIFGVFAGAFFATRQGFIRQNPSPFRIGAGLAIVVLGCMGSQLGVALAALT